MTLVFFLQHLKLKYIYTLKNTSDLKGILCLLAVMLSSPIFAQKKDSIPLSQQYLVITDTTTIRLKEVVLLSKRKFESQEDVNYYYWFRKKVFKAYPYAILATKRLDTLAGRLEKIKSKSDRRRYVKIIQRYLEGEFTDQLKKMTLIEGRILIKLIHRQTGYTVFDQIREFRSGWNAFWYNTTANMFSLSLKTEYNPELENEDFLIEDILQQAFTDGVLQMKKPRVEFDFNRIYQEKDGKIDVEVYKQLFAKARKKQQRKAN